MNRILAVTLTMLLAITLACAGWARWSHQRAAAAISRAEAAEAQVVEFKRTTALLEASLRKSRERAVVAQQEREAVDAAIKDNPGWASELVPAGVWESLGYPAPTQRVD